jgi:3-methyladenine DNA glycosylase AlkC
MNVAQLARRGARHPSLVPPHVLGQLERGEESANHMEQIALDMGRLLTFAFPELAAFADSVRRGGLVARMRMGGRILWESGGADRVAAAAIHSSDTVRGWAAMAVGARYDLALEERLSMIRPFADDRHFAVREWAWLSVRGHVSDQLDHALVILRRSSTDPSANIRRFSSEVTRPRGVWSGHIRALKAEPWKGLPVIAPLRADSSRYVQTSVANWLNDASKDAPDWVARVCEEWLAESPVSPTEWICNRALRTIRRGQS